MQIIGKYFTIDSVKIDTVPEDWVGHDGLRRLTEEEIEEMMNAALHFCSDKSNNSIAEIEELISKSDLWANSTFRYAIALEIKKALLSSSKVRDLYLHGSVLGGKANLNSNINLILQVMNTKEDFQYWLVLLNKDLVKKFRERFIGSGFFRAFLDCHVVTDEDVKLRVGYSALLATAPNATLTSISDLTPDLIHINRRKSRVV